MKKLSVEEMAPYDAAVQIRDDVESIVWQVLLEPPYSADSDYLVDMCSVEVELPGATEEATLDVFAQVSDDDLDSIKDKCVSLLSSYGLDSKVESCSDSDLVIKIEL